MSVDVIAEAVRVSQAMERRHHMRVEPGELLGPAWEGASRHPPHAGPAARWWSLHYLRQRDHRRRVGTVRTFSVSNVPSAMKGRSPENCWGDLEPRARPDETATPAQLWNDTRDRRFGWDWRCRVWLYLIAVEGWELTDVATAFGLSRGRVTTILQSVVPTGAFASLASARQQFNKRDEVRV